MRIIIRITAPRHRFLPYLLLFSLLIILVVVRSTNLSQSIGRVLTSDAVSFEGRVESKNLGGDPEEFSMVIFNGSKVNVRKGIALIELDQSNGMVGLCGNASVSVLHSKRSMLYGLQSGTLSVESSSTSMDRVLTPDFTVEWRPSNPWGKKQGVVKVDPSGGLCLQNIEGDVTVSDIFHGTSLRIPSGASVQLRVGELEGALFLKNLDCGCTPPMVSTDEAFRAPQTGSVSSPVAPGSSLSQLPSSPTTSARALPEKTPAPATPRSQPPEPARVIAESTPHPSESTVEKEAAALTGYRAPSISPHLRAKESHRPSFIRFVGRKLKSFFKKILFIESSPKPTALSSKANASESR